MHDAVHGGLLAGRAGGLQRTGRIVQPHVHALNQALGEGDIITRDEDDAAQETVLLGDLDDLFDEVLAHAVGRVRLAGEDELHRALGVVDDGVELVEVAEQQRGTLVGREAAGESDGQHVLAQTLLDRDHLARRVVRAQDRIGEAFADGADQFLLEGLADVPDLRVRHGVDALEALLVVVVRLELGAEHLGVQLLPILRRPGRVVDAVGDVADIKLLGEVAREHVREDVLADLAVQHGHAVDILRQGGGERAHGELLVSVVRIDLAQAHHRAPIHAETVGILSEEAADHLLRERVMAGRDRGVRRVEAGGADELQRLREGEMALLHALAHEFQAGESGVTLIVVVDAGRQAQRTQGAHATDAQQELLLQTVLPVATVELVRDLAVLRSVGFIVGIEQIEVGTAHGHLPDTRAQRTAGHLHLDGLPGAVLVEHRLRRDLHEVLRLVLGHLVALRREALGEVAETVQETDRHQVDVHVGSLLQVVAGQDAQAAGVDHQGSVQAIFHAEVSDGRFRPLLLFGHVGVELLHHPVEAGEEFGILGKFLISFQTDLVQDDHRVVAGFVPQIVIHGAEQRLGVVVPAPPEVLAEGLQTRQLLRKMPRHHHALPHGRGNVIIVYHTLLLYFSAMALLTRIMKSLSTFI